MGFQFISYSDAEDSLSPDVLSPSYVFCSRGITEDAEDIGKPVLSSMAHRGCELVQPLHKVGFPGGSEDKTSACKAGDPGSIPGSEGPLEEGMASRSCILAWSIPWTEEPSRLQSIGLHRVKHD